MPTTAIATAIFNTLRTKLSAADITVRMNGKSMIGLLAIPTSSERTTLYGADDGYDSSLYVITSDLPAQGVEDGDIAELQNGAKWDRRRILSIETKSQVVKRFALGSEHRQ